MNTLTQKLLFRQSVILSQLYYSINAMLFKGVEWTSFSMSNSTALVMTNNATAKTGCKLDSGFKYFTVLFSF